MLGIHTRRLEGKAMSREEIASIMASIARSKEARLQVFLEEQQKLAVLAEELAIIKETVGVLRENSDKMKRLELVNVVCAMLELWQGLKLKELGVNPVVCGEVFFFPSLS
jgi:hypothetical protein